MTGLISPTELMVLVITIIILIATLVAGFALLFYFLSERSHRFDVNIMHNMTELNKLLKHEIEQLKAEIMILRQVPGTSRISTREYVHESNTDDREDILSGIPSPNPQIGDLTR